MAGALCAGLGLALGALFWWEEIEALQRLREEVGALRGQLQPAPDRPVAPQAVAAHGELPPGPDSGQAPIVWPWLQERLQAHGLQVLALRPGAPETLTGLPVQTVALELEGRWSDWQAFERQLDRHAPWWTPVQWQVTPASGPGQVRMLWHLRWGWRPQGLAQAPTPALPLWPLEAGAAPALALFGEPAAAAVAASPAAPPASLPADPALWPVQALRLQGVWQQTGVAHAVLGQGLRQVVVTPGQRVGREGYEVWRVNEGQVVLRPADGTGPDIHLELTGATR